MRLSTDSIEIINESLARTRERRQVICEAEDLLECLISRLGYRRAASVVRDFVDQRSPMPFVPTKADLDSRLRVELLPAASELAEALGRKEVAPEDLLQALLVYDGLLEETLRIKLLDILGHSRSSESVISRCPEPEDGRAEEEGNSPMSRFLEGVEGDKYDSLLPRPRLEERVLVGLQFGSVVITGEPGSGRKSLMRRCARELSESIKVIGARGVQLRRLNLVELVSGTSYRGELEERLQRIFRHLMSMDDLPLILLDDVSSLKRSSGGGSFDIASAFLPYLERRQLRLLGCATNDSYRESVEADPSFAQCFSRIDVTAASQGESERMVRVSCERIATDYSVHVDDTLCHHATSLCDQYLPQFALPGSAIRLIEDAAARSSFRRARSAARGETADTKADDLTRGDLLSSLSERFNIPFYHLNSSPGQRIQRLRTALEKNVFGQDAALERLIAAVTIASANISDHRRPLCRLFFVGPPGTGKTESARMLARHLLGSEDALLRFDMSEFASESGVSTLIGSDKGLVGSHEGGRLTEPLRINPHRVILFDEIEKAHRSIYNLLLNPLDEGRLTDKLGNQVSFRHAYMIFTSNEGFEKMSGLQEGDRDAIEQILSQRFSPEFLDRAEYIIPFQPLSAEARRLVCTGLLTQLAGSVSCEHGLALTWTDEIVESAATERPGHPGARDILRFISDKIRPSVASAIVNADANSANGKVLHIGWYDGNVVISNREARSGHTVGGGSTV